MAHNFVRDIIDEHLRTGRFTTVRTRFPPEPNGYLHIGHAKSIHLNFGLARDYKGLCNLRMDDTNPETESIEYANAIKEDVRWLGFDWEDREYYASDYYERLYDWAVVLIKKGVAYVCDLDVDQVREYRGTVNKPGTPSPFRDRTVAENLDLFARMRAGEFPDGSKTLRAKIDMAAPNMLLRDPLMYRIRREHHYRRGDDWCIYPTYDWAHGQSDSIEGVTHSICTLEFEVHRPLYDWYLDQLGVHHPQQIEFARLNLSHTVLSKRRLLELVEAKLVSGWDDPRMPTISGFRRRGFTAEAIANFAEIIGVAKDNSIVDMPLLEMCVREHLNRTTPRVMAVLRPLKVVITNYPEDKVEEFDCVNNPENPDGRHAPRPVLARALDRARRLHGGPAVQVLPALARQRGPSPLRLLRQVRRGRQGRLRQRGRAPLHLRSRDPRRRQSPRRPKGQGHPPLGLGTARHRGRGPALRHPVHGPRPLERRRGRRLEGHAQPQVDRGHPRRQGRAGPRLGLPREPLAVRAAGLLLRRPPRFEARRPRLQPHGDPPRRVGEDRQGGPDSDRDTGRENK